MAEVVQSRPHGFLIALHSGLLDCARIEPPQDFPVIPMNGWPRDFDTVTLFYEYTTLG
jgi:hypothetical protein